jgi:hypothetical protein
MIGRSNQVFGLQRFNNTIELDEELKRPLTFKLELDQLEFTEMKKKSQTIDLKQIRTHH